MCIWGLLANNLAVDGVELVIGEDIDGAVSDKFLRGVRRVGIDRALGDGLRGEGEVMDRAQRGTIQLSVISFQRIDDHRGECAAEDGGHLHEGAACLAGVRLLGGVHATDFAIGMESDLLHPCADGFGECVAFDGHEFAGGHGGGVESQGGTHGGEDLHPAHARRVNNKVCLGIDAIDGIDEEVEGGKGFSFIHGVYRYDLGIGVDGQESFAENFHFGSADGLACSGELSVDVRGLDDVAIDEGEMDKPGTYERLGAP